MKPTILSIIIPVLNEATIIRSLLLQLQNDVGIEIIVVDGGSQDNTAELVKLAGVKCILAPQTGRANQMNIGAAIATGDILLFLHADTQLPPDYLNIIKAALAQSKAIAGAFELAIDGDNWSLRLVERLVKWRSRWCSLPYGDQAIFVRRNIFEEIDGFANLPIMEDFELIQRLKKQGRIAIAPAAVLTSSRRWQKLGVFKTTLINQLIIIGYSLGVSPKILRKIYNINSKIFIKN